MRELLAQFVIPQGAIRLWGTAPEFDALPVALPFAQPVSDDVKLFAASLAQPYCGLNAGFEAAGWLEEPVMVMSMAMIPLRLDPGSSATGAGTFGLLVLASPDATRYSADMGTEFLAHIGELASAALAQLVRPAG